MAKVVANRAFLPSLYRIVDERLGSVAREMARTARIAVGTPFPPASTPYTPPHKRSGNLQDAIFHSRIQVMDWAFGVNQVQSQDEHDRKNLGLWMELGTGKGRGAFPKGTTSVRSVRHDTATTGSDGFGGIAPRPFIIPTLMNHGPQLARKHFG